ncbi:MAG TPA: hypothetical protein VFJ47_15955 [Terriglobales bacterium]|nr:hypothetical protein [Terriglobales bacterium]
MDEESLAVIAVIVSLVSLAIAAWLISLYRQRKLAREACEWTPVEAIIESGALEAMRESGKIVFPTFAFSYRVSDQYYSGRFSLRANISTARANMLIAQMLGRKILVRYDPGRPQRWFIPDELIEGYKVEQKLGSHVIHDYSPAD